MPKRNQFGSPGLTRVGHAFYVEWPIPADLQKHPDLVDGLKRRKRWRIALGTDSPRVAAALAPPVVAKLRSRIEKARYGYDPLLIEAGRLRQALARAGEWEERDAIEGAIAAMADRVAYDGGPAGDEQKPESGAPADEAEAAKLYDYAMGNSAKTDAYLDLWLKTITTGEKNKAQKRRAVERLAERFPTTGLILRKDVSGWFSDLFEEGRGLSVSSLDGLRADLRQYWQFLQDREVVAEDLEPFNVNLPKKQKNGKNGSYECYTTMQAAELYTAAVAKDDRDLATAIAMGAYTGARLQPVCHAEIENIDLEAGTWFIPHDKTGAGRRIIPLHSALVPILKRRIGNRSEGFLFPDLLADKWGYRTNQLQKRFSALKRKLGMAPKQTFHSFRHTFINALKYNGVPEAIAEELAGHSAGKSSYKMYGAHDATQHAKHVEALAYPAPLGTEGV
jgi:integrase